MFHWPFKETKYSCFCGLYIFLFSCAQFPIPISSAAASATDQKLRISNSVANHLCGQHEKYQESNSLQTPAKTRPENDDAKCGWLIWTKSQVKSECDSSKPDSSCPESEPEFTFESCEETAKAKSGRTAKSGSGKEEEYVDPCDVPLKFPGLEIVSPPNKYPSLVAIHRGEGCYRTACSGLIINEEWIVVPVTTGCFVSFTPEHPDDFHIIAGDRQVYVEEGTEQVRSVGEFINHPDFEGFYSFKFYKGNLGLVRLDKPLRFNENVQPVNLTAIKEISSSSASASSLENLKVVSWLPETSTSDENDLNQTSLIEFPVEFIPDSECNDTYIPTDGVSTESLICAGNCLVSDDFANKGAKHGFLFTFQKNPNADSDSEELIPIPVGIGPIRRANQQPSSPYGIFTDLSFYLPWIEETIKNQGKIGVKGRSSRRTKGKLGRGSGSGNGSGRLVGSSDSTPHKYPSMVNFLLNVTSNCMQHGCGGAILSPDWILTAAHCFSLMKLEKHLAIAGDHDVSIGEDSEQRVQIEKIILFDKYNPNLEWAYDIALLKVSPPFQFNDKIKAVKLPPQDFETQGPTFQAVGWGLHDGYFPHILQEVELPFVPLDECIKLWADAGATRGQSGWLPLPQDFNLCAGALGKTVCGGDSGSPLYLIDEAGEQVVVGIVSQGGNIRCGYDMWSGMRSQKKNNESWVPASFSKVADYVDWIKKTAQLP